MYLNQKTIAETTIDSECDVLRDLVPFVQFQKREKHPWRSVNFSKVADFSLQLYSKVTFLHECFSRF